MKNKLITLLTAAGLLFTGCSQQTSTNTSNFTFTDASSESLSTSEESTSTLKHPKSNWGGQLGDDIIESFTIDIPTLGYGELMQYDLSKDSFNDATIFIYWSLGDDTDFTKALDSYYNTLSFEGWTVTSSTKRQFDGQSYYEYKVYYADLVISDDVGIEIQFLQGSLKGIDCLGFYIFSYPHYDKATWPSSVVNKLIDSDIPHLSENGYTYTATLFDNSSTKQDNSCEILIEGTEYDDQEKYKDLLVKCGYSISELTLDDNYGFEYYIAYSPEFNCCLRFWFDLMQNHCLTIYIYPISAN